MTGTSEPHPVTGQPVGLPVDATPARRPSPVTLEGRHGHLERLAQRHDAALWNAVQGHDHIWTYMSYGPLADCAAFSAWLAGRLQLDDPYSYAIVDRSGQAVGIATLMEIRPAMRVIEVEGILRGHMITKDRSRDTAYYSMLDTEWPARKAAFERWLAAENFDAQGRQRTSLSELNAVR